MGSTCWKGILQPKYTLPLKLGVPVCMSNALQKRIVVHVINGQDQELFNYCGICKINVQSANCN